MKKSFNLLGIIAILLSLSFIGCNQSKLVDNKTNNSPSIKIQENTSNEKITIPASINKNASVYVNSKDYIEYSLEYVGTQKSLENVSHINIIAEEDAMESIRLIVDRELSYVEIVNLDINGYELDVVKRMENIPPYTEINLFAYYSETIPNKIIRFELKNGNSFSLVPRYNGKTGDFDFPS